MIPEKQYVNNKPINVRNLVIVFATFFSFFLIMIGLGAALHVYKSVHHEEVLEKYIQEHYK